jgi:hypothetical protein
LRAASYVTTTTEIFAEEIKKLNKEGVKPKDLAEFAQVKEKVEEIGYQNVVGQDSLTRFEKNFSNNKKRRPNRKPRKPNPGGPKNEKAQ